MITVTWLLALVMFVLAMVGMWTINLWIEKWFNDRRVKQVRRILTKHGIGNRMAPDKLEPWEGKFSTGKFELYGRHKTIYLDTREMKDGDVFTYNSHGKLIKKTSKEKLKPWPWAEDFNVDLCIAEMELEYLKKKLDGLEEIE